MHGSPSASPPASARGAGRQGGSVVPAPRGLTASSSCACSLLMMRRRCGSAPKKNTPETGFWGGGGGGVGAAVGLERRRAAAAPACRWWAGDASAPSHRAGGAPGSPALAFCSPTTPSQRPLPANPSTCGTTPGCGSCSTANWLRWPQHSSQYRSSAASRSPKVAVGRARNCRRNTWLRGAQASGGGDQNKPHARAGAAAVAHWVVSERVDRKPLHAACDCAK